MAKNDEFEKFAMKMFKDITSAMETQVKCNEAIEKRLYDYKLMIIANFALTLLLIVGLGLVGGR